MQNKSKTVFIIAGEVSGDVLGAHIMQQMPNVNFVGIGGENMISAGLTPIFPMGDLAVMGIIEVAAHARTLTKRIRETVNAILETKPDIVVTIDAPGFAKSVIKKIKDSAAGQELIKKGLKFHHVVAPQVWAWRPGRAKKYAKLFDKLYAFFDFEVPYFTKYGLDTVAVGHPIADNIIGKKNNTDTESDKKIITLIPGSRISEVKRLLPIIRDVVDMLSRNGFLDYQFVIPTVETTAEYIKSQIKTWDTKPILLPSEKRYDIYSKTYIAIAASGTVSAELAMMHIPAIIVYKMNPITTWFARRLINIKWVSLVNILLKRTIYPELLGGDATPEKIIDSFGQLTIPSVRNKMTHDLESADKLWRHPDGSPSKIIATEIIKAM